MLKSERLKACLREVVLTQYKTYKKWRLATAFMLVAVIIFGSARFVYFKNSPDVLFLTDHAGAQWIKYDTEFILKAKRFGQFTSVFRHTFKMRQPVDDARITLQALKHCQLILDGKTIFTSPHDPDKWRQTFDITIPFTVEAGSHDVDLIITSDNSHPAVIAYSDSLPIRTGPEWLAKFDGKNWKPAVSVSEIRLPELSLKFPRAIDAFVKILPYIAIVFALVFTLLLINELRSEKLPELLNWRPEPSHIRLFLIVLWLILTMNNIFKIEPVVGYDLLYHIEYISFIVRKGSLPLAPDGWQMFQSPLYYMVSAPFFGLLTKWFHLPLVIKMLRAIPIVCGLLQIEIVYRASRLVFPQKKELQYIAIVTGSLMPMHTYICQVVGNEPLAGCLMSVVILYCLKLIMPAQKEQGLWFFILLGFFWGLALLSKVTAILLFPVLVLALFVRKRIVQKSFKYFIFRLTLVLSISIMTSGWYYFRNYIELGSFFIGGWDPSRGIQWWQDPSFRTWSQLLSFGRSLIYPVYSGACSFLDSIYSTLWLDGFNSGIVNFKYRPPWNLNFMAAGALLSLIPTFFIMSSIWTGFRKQNQSRNAVVFSIGTIVLFIAVLVDLFLQLPTYSTAKSTYTLGLLPCYAILTAVGAEPFIRKKIVRSVAMASFSCWAFAAYAAYFVIAG